MSIGFGIKIEQSLQLKAIARMETEPQNDVVISSFCEITSATDQEARFFLESHNWDLDAAVSTFFENDSTDPVPQPPPSHALSPSSSHSPDYSPTRSPTRSRSPSPARPNYHLRPRRAAAAKGSTNPPAARTRGGGIRTLSDLNRRQANDGASDSDDDDDDEPNEYYTGGEKSGMLVQDPTRGGGNDVESIFAQARQFHQDPVEASSSSGSKSFSGTARTLAGETVPAAAPQSINHTVAFWNNGFTVDDGPLRRVDDPANAAFMDSIKKSECPKELEPANRTTTVEVSLIKREEDYREPVKQRNQASFQGVGRTLSASTSESPATESTAAAVPPLTAAPLPSMGLTVDEALPSTSIQLRLADGTRMVSRFNNHHTIGDIHAFIDASRPGGARNYRLQTMGFPPKQLTDLDQTIEQAGAANSVIIQRL